MKKQLLSLAALALSIFGLQTVSAQNYQPFSLNHTYHFSAQDSIYALKIDSSFVQNGDSVFVFNNIARRVYNHSKPGSCPMATGTAGALYQIYGQNQLGNKMIKKPNGVYLFETLQGGQFELRTKASVGQSWPVMAGMPITITLTSKGVEPVLSTTDSVLTYTVGTGEVIKLSKNYGFLKVPNLASYTDPYFPAKDLQLYALPEKGLGTAYNNQFAIFDFQPGDVFMHYFTQTEMSNNLCMERWTKLEITSRTQSPNYDTIYYQAIRQELTKGYGSPGAPAGFCNIPTGFTLNPATTTSWAVSAAYRPEVTTLSNNFYIRKGSLNYISEVNTGIYKDNAFQNLVRMEFSTLMRDSCANTFDRMIDSGLEYSFAPGLGQIERLNYTINNTQHEILQGYQKNGVVYGNLRTFSQIMGLARDEKYSSAVSVYPNPAENLATLKFDQPLTYGSVSVSILNTLGQVVLQQHIAEIPDRQVQLSLEKLSKGIYVVQVKQNDKTYISRLVKQ